MEILDFACRYQILLQDSDRIVYYTQRQLLDTEV
jgi:hypothetical protein